MPQVAGFVLSRLREWGIHRVYGYPGDGINGFLGACDRAGLAVHGFRQKLAEFYEKVPGAGK